MVIGVTLLVEVTEIRYFARSLGAVLSQQEVKKNDSRAAHEVDRDPGSEQEEIKARLDYCQQAEQKKNRRYKPVRSVSKSDCAGGEHCRKYYSDFQIRDFTFFSL